MSDVQLQRVKNTKPTHSHLYSIQFDSITDSIDNHTKSE